MSLDFWNSCHNSKPINQGWYPVLLSTDAEACVHPLAAHWNGSKWSADTVVAYGCQAESERKAEELAYLHDPDW